MSLTVTVLITILTPCILLIEYSSATKTHVSVHTDGFMSEISDHFIGVTVDTSVLRHWPTTIFRSKELLTLARGLTPVYLRMGGTSADYTIYSTKNESISHTYMHFELTNRKPVSGFRLKRNAPFKNFTMTAPLWDEVNLFVKNTGWDFIFDLNSLQRNADGSWDSGNALQLMKYTLNKGYKLVGWELGNEPNVYATRVNSTQLSKDYVKLRQLIVELFPGKILIGPSVTMLSTSGTDVYFETFLKGPASKAVDASTFHHYYGYEGSFTLLDFMDPKILDNLQPQINVAKKYTKEYCPGKQVWIGETSSVWGGGKPGYSDRYVAGFMWLDKLGVSAKLGVDSVIRQDFYGNNYGLVALDGTPNPDYWLTLLYKYLVGGRVLNTTAFDVTTKTSSDHLRLYSHCTNTQRTNYTSGSITVYGMNLNAVETSIYFEQYIETDLHLYLFEPVGDYGLTSRNVSLNGKLLLLTEEGELPNLMIPKVVRSPVIIPGFRYAFIVIPSANVSLCL